MSQEQHIETDQERQERETQGMLRGAWRIVGPTVNTLIAAALIGIITLGLGMRDQIIQMRGELATMQATMVKKDDLYLIGSTVSLHAEKLSQIDKSLSERTSDRYRGEDAKRDRELFLLKLDAVSARVDAVEGIVNRLTSADKHR